MKLFFLGSREKLEIVEKWLWKYMTLTIAWWQFVNLPPWKSQDQGVPFPQSHRHPPPCPSFASFVRRELAKLWLTTSSFVSFVDSDVYDPRSFNFLASCWCHLQSVHQHFWYEAPIWTSFLRGILLPSENTSKVYRLRLRQIPQVLWARDWSPFIPNLEGWKARNCQYAPNPSSCFFFIVLIIQPLWTQLQHQLMERSRYFTVYNISNKKYSP